MKLGMNALLDGKPEKKWKASMDMLEECISGQLMMVNSLVNINFNSN